MSGQVFSSYLFLYFIFFFFFLHSYIFHNAGTSGRIAAVDAVEIPCTFGLKADKFVAIICGGIADASITIESHDEEGLLYKQYL